MVAVGRADVGAIKYVQVIYFTTGLHLLELKHSHHVSTGTQMRLHFILKI
jgi:hypothetical protein